MLVLVASFVITASLAPVVRSVLLRRGVLDVPNDRSSHAVPVPRGGGIACVFGALGGLGVAALLNYDVPWLALAAVLLLAGVGYADDTYGLPPVLRLGAQVVIGGLAGLAVGGLGWAAIGALVLPALVNAVNFMDGINGITGLNMAVWGGVALAVGYLRDAPVLVTIGAVVAGAALGFLPWNAPTARLFLGDVGSYFFGGIVTVGVLAGARATSSATLLVVLVAPLAIYLADTGTTLIKRALRREQLTVAHREHVYQRLVHQAGLSHLLVASATALLSLTIAVAWLPGSVVLGVVITLVVVVGYLSRPSLLKRRGVSAGRTPNGIV